MSEVQLFQVGTVMHLNAFRLLYILRLALFVPLLVIVIIGIWGCSPWELRPGQYQ